MQYYPNEVKAGTDVYNAYTEHENSNRRVTILCCDGMLQSGKTKGYKYGLRMIADNHPTHLPPINMTVLTTYSLNELNTQLAADLRDLDDIVETRRITNLSANIKKENLSELRCLRGGIVVIDEGEYGLVSAEHNGGISGRVERLIEYLVGTNESYFIMVVGATNYSLNIAETYGDLIVPKKSVVFEPGEGYRGIKELYEESDKFYDMDKVDSNGLLSKSVLDLLKDELNIHNNGIYLMRASDRKHTTAESWKKQLDNKFDSKKFNLEIFTIYSGQNYDISEKLKELLRLSREKNVIFIVCGAMAAGYTMHQTQKKIIRFILDISKVHSTVVQGLIGRACGYNLDYLPTVISSAKACETYLNYQNSVRGLCDFNPQKGRVSTHLKAQNEFNNFVGCEFLGEFQNIAAAEEYLKLKGYNDKISIASENVKHKATRIKFKRRKRELAKLKEGMDANYIHIGWEREDKSISKFTALHYKNGTVDLVMKKGEMELRHDNTVSNSSIFGKNVI